MSQPQPEFSPAEIELWKYRSEKLIKLQTKKTNELKYVQRFWKLTDSDMLGLTGVLSQMMGKRVVVSNIEKLGVLKRTSEYIEDCEKLREAAKVISGQFQFLKQFLPIDLAFRGAYFEQSDLATKCASLEVMQKEWASLRDRLHDDAELIDQLATEAMVKLKQRSDTTPEEWRDESFKRLIALLDHVFSGSEKNRTKLALDLLICADDDYRTVMSEKNRTKLALDLWNVYFGDEFELTEELARKVLEKTPKIKKSKSQGNDP